MKKNKLLVLVILVLSSIFLSSCLGRYPRQEEISIIVPWTVDGSGDNISREFATIFEEKIGQKVNIVNKEGATGAVGTEYAYDQESDGYTLLLTNETLSLLEVMGLSKLSHDDFEQIKMLTHHENIVVVSEDSEYESLEDIIINIKQEPGKIKMAYTAPGSNDYIQGILLQNQGFDFTMVPSGGEKPSLNFIKNNTVDFALINYSIAKDEDVKLLETFNLETIDNLEEKELFVNDTSEIHDYLDFSYHNILMYKKDIPQDAKETLEEAINETIRDERWIKFIKENRYEEELGMNDDKIKKYLNDYRSFVSWVLYDSGVLEMNPEELNIKRK